MVVLVFIISIYTGVSSSGIWRRVVCCVATDVSEEHSASIFRVEEKSSKPRRHISEDDTLQHHRCENLKSYIDTNLTSVHIDSRQGTVL
jgi:hypothetical protein